MEGSNPYETSKEIGHDLPDVSMTIKILDQKQAGEISEDEYKAKLGEMKKHLAAFGSKYSRE